MSEMDIEELTPEDARQRLASNAEIKLLDIRQPMEYEIVHLPNSILVTDEVAREILDTWSRDTEIVCYCHHGIRSYQAAMALKEHGFQKVAHITGGIDAWAQTVDPSLPRY